MSTTDAPATTQTTGPTITIPPGVQVQPGRQTTQTNGQGQVTQGTLYSIILPNGTTSSVFVPDSLLGNVAQIEALFTNKIAQLSVIPVG